MKPSKWVEEYNKSTLKPEPYFDLYEQFLGTREEAVFFIHERMKLRKTRENDSYFGYIKTLTDIIRSTLTFIGQDEMIIDNQFQKELGHFLSFMVCEKRFAINTYLATKMKTIVKEGQVHRTFATARQKSVSKLLPPQLRVAIISSIVRITKFFAFLQNKLIQFANKNRRLKERRITVSAMGKRCPVNYKLIKTLLNSLTRTIKRTLGGLRKKHKSRQEFKYLLKLNSCLSLFLDTQQEDLEPILDSLPRELSFTGTGTVIDSLISTQATTLARQTTAQLTPMRRTITANISNDDSEFVMTEESSDGRNSETTEGKNPKISQMMKNHSRGQRIQGNERIKEKRKRVSKLKKSRMVDSDDEYDEEMLEFVHNIDKIENTINFFEKKKEILKVRENINASISDGSYLGEFEEEREMRKNSGDSLILGVEDIESVEEDSQEEDYERLSPFSQNHWDLETRMNLFKELEPIKMINRIPDHLIYEAFHPMITPIKERVEEVKEENFLSTDFELMMKKKEKDEYATSGDDFDRVDVIDLSENLSENVNFTLDTYQKFKEDFLAHLKSKEQKLIELRKKNIEKAAHEKLEKEKQREEKEKRRGGWDRHRKIRIERKDNIPPAFAAKKIDLKEKISVKPEDFQFFDPKKVPTEIENEHVVETYENCIPDEKLFEGDIDFIEEDPWGFENSSFFSEVDSMLNEEELNHQSDYQKKFQYDMVRLTDISTQITMSSDSRVSSVIEGSEYFTPVSMKRMIKNKIQLDRYNSIKERNQWCITAQVVPRNFNSDSILYVQQESRKGYLKKTKVY